MSEMCPKLSLITVTYNSSATIGETLKSVRDQTYPNIEYIIIDGDSTDNTCQIIKASGVRVDVLRCEKDKGIYDAMNKGIGLATGDVIGFLNSDDFFSSPNSIAGMMNPFLRRPINISYGNLDYVHPLDTKKRLRRWVSGHFSQLNLQLGWMPAHPAFYARRELFVSLGSFDTSMKIAADYDLMVRFLRVQDPVSVFYVPECVVHMRAGGQSNRNGISTVWRAGQECVVAGQKNGLLAPRFSAMMKVLRKVPQLICKPAV